MPDSGADAAVFPSAYARVSQKVSGECAKLRDAQGRSIPIEEMRDVEVKLTDQSGKLTTLRERVAVSSQISQPIPSYGKLLECGWGIDSREQTLTHGAGVQIPFELRNRSMVVKGWIRVIEEPFLFQLKPMFRSLTQFVQSRLMSIQTCVLDLQVGHWTKTILELDTTDQTASRTPYL